MSSLQRTICRSKHRLNWTKETWNIIALIGKKICQKRAKKTEWRKSRRIKDPMTATK